MLVSKKDLAPLVARELWYSTRGEGLAKRRRQSLCLFIEGVAREIANAKEFGDTGCLHRFGTFKVSIRKLLNPRVRDGSIQFRPHKELMRKCLPSQSLTQ